ncbi:probable calcium-binding protein CML25/26 [Phragmites australis]|uniref:probable calcium-binding protein CML25/26 n=1 Tax=Phragmites australis TaxID=29695 RepID=UPI002D76F6D6|nr:probable calcium-binding protein CML25/26 [Phragmites australis]
MVAMVASSLFASLDKDGDGKVSASELRGCMAAALGEDMSEEEAAAILAAADADGDGLLDRDEFLSLAREAECAADEGGRYECLREAFGMYANAADGEEQCITPASLKEMLSRLLGTSQHLGMEECRAMICRFDLNGDGVLSFDEFRVMMHDGLM